MKYEYSNNGEHCFYWGKNGFWLVDEQEIKEFKKMIEEWKAESVDYAPIDYEFCYTEILDWFTLQDWHKVPKDKQNRILEYLTQQV